MAKKFVQKPYTKYVLTPEAIFYDIKQVLLNMNHPQVCSLTMDQALMYDPELKQILTYLEKRYGVAIPEEAGLRSALTVKDFCEICAKVITKKVPAKLTEVLDFIKYILVSSTDLNKNDLTNTSKMGRSLVPGQRGLGLDDLDRLQTIISLGKVYGVEIEETKTIKNANTLIEFAEACRLEINKNVKTKDLSIKSAYTKTIDTMQKNVSDKNPEPNVVSYTYDNIQEAIKKHLEKEYNRYNVTPKNNWFIHLGLTELQRCDFFKWVEKTFDMELPYFYFENMDALYKVIYYTKMKRSNFITRMKSFLSRTK